MCPDYVRPDIPFDRELLLPLPGPTGHSRWIRFIRERGRDFDATDRTLAALVRPTWSRTCTPSTWQAAARPR
jgi:hypothetical protein